MKGVNMVNSTKEKYPVYPVEFTYDFGEWLLLKDYYTIRP